MNTGEKKIPCITVNRILFSPYDMSATDINLWHSHCKYSTLPLENIFDDRSKPETLQRVAATQKCHPHAPSGPILLIYQIKAQPLKYVCSGNLGLLSRRRDIICGHCRDI
jgi:hypothetical protein